MNEKNLETVEQHSDLQSNPDSMEETWNSGILFERHFKENAIDNFCCRLYFSLIRKLLLAMISKKIYNYLDSEDLLPSRDLGYQGPIAC